MSLRASRLGSCTEADDFSKREAVSLGERSITNASTELAEKVEPIVVPDLFLHHLGAHEQLLLAVLGLEAKLEHLSPIIIAETFISIVRKYCIK
jgi:hypothetical protein